MADRSGYYAVIYLAMAYVLLPALWRHHDHEPGLAVLPMVPRTGSGIPGDAINVGLVGSKEDIVRAMQAAEWFPADPITLRTSTEIIGSEVLDRPDQDAPLTVKSTLEVSSDGIKRTKPPGILPPPSLIALKDQVWARN
jgi:LssY-like putative type I secretion system component LssY